MRSSKATLLSAIAVLAGIVAYLRRPVRRPDAGGHWAPLDE